MKTNMESRIYVDMDVILETEFSEQQIVDMIKRISFNDFKVNEFNVVKLDDGSEVTVFPHYNIYNDLVMIVSNF